MPLRSALALVVVLWAAIFLPALGSLEIKGEEGRRILPAVTMLESGNWIVPQVGSEPYFRKPPLVNWLVGASFKLFGARNEWTARVPSAICVLLVALAFVTVARSVLGENGSVVAALAWLTNFGMVEKGRLIEIEALYASLTGLAFICWCAWFLRGRSRWLTWIVPWIFLGLGLLAKGPLHLLFFYGVVSAVLYRRRELSRLLNFPHLIGIAVMLGIFATWAIPCLEIMHQGNVAHTWSRQFSGRLSGDGFRFAGWIQNIPRGLGYFLPWLLLIPVAGKVEFVDEVERRTVRGLGWGILGSFLFVCLLPGSLSRYSMPLLAPACWYLAMLLCAERLDLPNRFRLRWPAKFPPPLRLPVLLASIVALAMWIYAIGIVPRLQQRQKVRTIAAKIDAALPAGATLYAVDPDYQPFLFYLRSPIIYRSDIASLPAGAQYVLVQPENETALAQSKQWAPRAPKAIVRMTDYRARSVILFAIQ
ncbi:MAG: glycosyltransferase family 39 protein [Verrucomicrobiota bacterium]|nr:glycosyltransferase family 39 protein [Verrucomicrobiota bacterium]